jgi:hydroxymethylpyrimidine kinase/phosphomethylpyrimidine kinase/thiamine-phosphate diphosphorylase
MRPSLAASRALTIPKPSLAGTIIKGECGMIAWTIAGSDSSGCAGIQADLKTFHQLGVHVCSVITAVTAQNINQMTDVEYVNNTAAQIAILEKEKLPTAIKIGMLGKVDLLPFLKKYSGKVVLDPVMISSSGQKLFYTQQPNYISSLQKIFPFIDLLTPNKYEAEALTGLIINSSADIEAAADKIISLGVKSVLIKGGHLTNDKLSQDYWTDGTDSFWLANVRQANQQVRGTGCTLSSAIAAALALGYQMKDALVVGKMYVTQGIRLSNGSSLLQHAGWPENESDLPYLSLKPLQGMPTAFMRCGQEALGLYPIVDHTAWLQQLLPLGVKTIQLRIKDKQGVALENEIKQAVQLANQYNARLFINDYWELAIRYHAYGVHLGQGDLVHADIRQIRETGLRLGISTHCYYEVARAHAFRPSYMACGPIYPTTSKMMPFAPQGIPALHRWRRTLNYPLVAIGGINLDRLPDVLSTKVDGVAMISAITKAKNSVRITQKLLTAINNANT